MESSSTDYVVLAGHVINGLLMIRVFLGDDAFVILDHLVN